MAIEIREIHDEDDSELEGLFARAFGQDSPAGEWRWKYAGNPFGRGGRVAILDGRPVGHLGAWRTLLWRDGRPSPALSLCDSMTEPSVRARGRAAPFLRMGRDLMEGEGQNQEPPFVYGFPSERARAFGERFVGYRLVHWITRFDAEAEVLATLDLPAGSRIERSETVPPAYDELWQSICSAPGWRLDRSRERLNWRYYARPNRYYRMFFLWRQESMAAAAIVGFENDLGRLVELLVPVEDQELIPGFLAGIARDLIPDGVTRLETWANSERPLGRFLDADPRIRAEPSGIPLEIRPFDDEPSPELVASQLDYSGGDFDVY